MKQTNEELAVQAKGGDLDVLLSLWERVKRLAARIAIGYLGLVNQNGGCDLDDLIQCGYLAMVNAVDRFQEGRGAFSTLFVYYHRNKCRALLGLCGHVRKEHYDRVSLDAPIASQNGDEGCSLLELLPDTACAPVDESLDDSDLRECLRALVKKLSPRQREIIEQHYFGGRTLASQAETMGTSFQMVSSSHLQGLQRLRRLWVSSPDAMDLYNPYTYRFQGRRAFQSSMTSVVELAAFWNIDRDKQRDLIRSDGYAGIAGAIAERNNRKEGE